MEKAILSNKVLLILQKKCSFTTAFVIGCLLGVFSFLSLYGYKILNVTYVDWLMDSGDLTQHYLGWAFFRNEPWNFPIGIISSLGYPFGTSITFTDSIPLFAIFFKIINPLLPDQFQYFGLWGIFSFTMQGGISAIILNKYCRNSLPLIVGTAFFTFSPIMISRMFGHTALAGHWVILYAIVIWVYKSKIQSRRTECILWALANTLAILIHPYLTVMTLLIMLGYIIDDYLENKKALHNILLIISSISSIILCFWTIGGFINSTGLKTESYGLGHYSMNLNALLNPQGFSRVFKDLPLATSGQYEGFQFLGLGGIILLLYNIYTLINRINGDFKIRKVIPAVVVILISTVLAVSNKITINDSVLLEYQLPYFIERIWNIFRSSGRLFWVSYYIIMFFLIINFILTNKTQNRTGIILLFVFIIQYADMSHVLEYKKQYFNRDVSYSNPLVSTFWTDASEKFENIVFLPPEISDYDHFSWYAVNNGMTLNTGYIARGPYQEIEKLAQEKLSKLKNGEIEDRDIYIIKNIDELSGITPLCGQGQFNCFNVDSYNVVISDNKLDLKNYKDINKIKTNTIDIERYLDHLKKYNNGELILASVRDEASYKLTNNIVKKMKQLGFQQDLTGKFQWSYIGLISNGKSVQENASLDFLEISLPMGTKIGDKDLLKDINIKSAGSQSGNISSILIGGKEFSINTRGINFVVYDIENDKVLELANFDLFDKFSGTMITLK